MLGFYLNLCDSDGCSQVEVDPAAIAISSCESGDGHNFGTIDWNAVSKTNDTGAFQFNDKTWEWLTGQEGRAKDSPQALQLEMFYKLWNNGYGWSHWNSSKPCWSQWIKIDSKGRAVWRTEIQYSISQQNGVHRAERYLH